MGAPGAPGAGSRAQGGGGGAGGRGRTTTVPTHPTLHGIGGGGVGREAALSFVFSYIVFLGAHSFHWERPGRRALGELATSRITK